MLDKKYLNGLLDNLSPTTTVVGDKNHRILLVDSMNTFIRCFAMINHINPNGQHTGGLTGFIKSIGYIIKHIQPTKVVLVFDGKGSTQNKKNLYPDYKGNRNINRITNWDVFENKDEETEAMYSQLLRLVEYLKQLPVYMLSIEKVEADDVIGYLAQHYYDISNDIVIMSADKDFLQLINDKVQVYSPTKKKFYKSKELEEEYGLTPQNFLTHKILLGDKSDNLPGIEGLGTVKLRKFFPEVFEKDFVSLEDIIEKSNKQINEHAIFTRISSCENQLNINKKLMNLIDYTLPEPDIEFIKETLGNNTLQYNKMKFVTMWNNDKIGNDISNLESYLDNTFKSLK